MPCPTERAISIEDVHVKEGEHTSLPSVVISDPFTSLDGTIPTVSKKNSSISTEGDSVSTNAGTCAGVSLMLPTSIRRRSTLGASSSSSSSSSGETGITKQYRILCCVLWHIWNACGIMLYGTSRGIAPTKG